MDDSWRMRMGMPTLPRRRSMEDTPSRRPIFGQAETLDPDDFADVYGGPPRSVLLRKFAGDFTKPATTDFYEEVFRKTEIVTPGSKKGGRSLPAFRIPVKSEGFYGDIFGSDDDHRRSRERSRPNSKAKSKSNSSSVLSSEELSPLRPVIGEDVALSSFTSKLRPISVPCRWNSTAMMPEEYPKKQGKPSFPFSCSSNREHQYIEKDYHENCRSFYNGFQRRVSSPETVSIELNSHRSVKVSVDEAGLNSCSSAVSSLHQDPEAESGIQDHVFLEQEDDEVMSSYVIEINCDHKEGTGETVSVDEAIAWAKEKFQAHISEKELSMRQHSDEQPIEMEGRPNSSELSDQQVDGNGLIQPTEEEEQRNWTAAEEEEEQSQKDIEVELLDEYLKLWSAGKETNIKLLLSQLHHILWPDSGWHAIPLTSLTESTQVKKAYQKARLCLHPDKLQQRGATLRQKYVAEKAFSILQDAWATYISDDVVPNQ